VTTPPLAFNLPGTGATVPLAHASAELGTDPATGIWKVKIAAGELPAVDDLVLLFTYRADNVSGPVR
jgi:hypothetical protein